MYDICIIGGGVAGCSIARELCRYQASIVVVEAKSDVCEVSKGNCAVIEADAINEDTLKSRYIILGAKTFRAYAGSLSVPFRASSLSFSEPSHEPTPARSLTSTVINPYDLVFALKENAEANGVNFLFDFEVKSFEFLDGSITVRSSSDSVQAKVVINCAGINGGKIARLLGDLTFLERKQTVTQNNNLCYVYEYVESTDGDYIVGKGKREGIYNVIALGTKGVTASHAIAMSLARSFNLPRRLDFNPVRKPIVRFKHLSIDEKNALISQNTAFGRVICRCEFVTEAEIVEAVRRGARSADGVIKRLGAGSGKCKGYYCRSEIDKIIKRELERQKEDV